VEQVVAHPTRAGFVEHLADGVCRRAFSSPEAIAYELTIAPALAAALEPLIRPLLTGPRTLDVGCGGGQIAKRLANDTFSVIGLDPSRSQVRRFDRRAPSAAGVVQARAEALPFASSTFDSLYSSCAWKHWPEPSIGTAECVRVTKSGGSIVVVEIDGSASPAEFWSFARRSRIPLGLRKAYLRFAMRTVVGVAPTRDHLASSFDGLQVTALSVQRVDGLPFLLATAATN
jgi:ubiquinone/menaquinone biosynthesis C-methylase UbiE